MTTLNNKKVTVKKARRCHGCRRLFPIGTAMNYWAGTDGGSFSATYSCMTCVEIMNMRQDPDEDGFDEGFVLDMLEPGETPESFLERARDGF